MPLQPKCLLLRPSMTPSLRSLEHRPLVHVNLPKQEFMLRPILHAVVSWMDGAAHHAETGPGAGAPTEG